ncbi:MAG: hypothetical protein JWQ74_627 [Marmoricola sp.]|nr:hypothetical protein [Marmoricola sp.]
MTARTGLRRRILWTTALVSLIAMAAMIGTVVLVLNAIARNNLDSGLEDRLAVVSAAISEDADRPVEALTAPVDSVDQSTWLYGPSGALLDGPRAGARVQAVADRLARVRVTTRADQDERLYLAAPVIAEGGARVGVLVVSASLEPYESTRTEVLLVLVALGVAVSGGATAIATWTMSRTLAPVIAMADLAEDWSERELDARFDESDSQHEIGHLGRTLNVLLDRVAGALRGEQRLTAELAHELRTPLSAIRGEAELALADTTDPGNRSRLERLLSSADQMGTTITTLLTIARGESGSERGTTAADVVRAALAGREVGPVVVEVDVPDILRLAATTDIAVRALSPLLDNAFRYAETTVTVTAHTSGRSVDIRVGDDGPGVGPSVEPDTIFDPGTHDPASPGVGLGLSLARRVARTLGGDVVLAARSPAVFVVTLPRS